MQMKIYPAEAPMVFRIDFPFLYQFFHGEIPATHSVGSGISHADRHKATSKVSLRIRPFD